jgi:AraC-like DNA-binding protein
MSIHIQPLIPAFKQLFRTDDFSQWEAGIKQNLGTHQSHLRSSSQPFHSCCHAATVGSLQILHLQGTGELELDRTQLDRGLLWLPLRGISEERINGRVVQATRGQAILIRPFDHLHGLTSAEMAGLSVVLPDSVFIQAEEGDTPLPPGQAGKAPEALLHSQHSSDQGVIALAMQLSRAVARRDPNSPILASHLLDQLEQTLSTAPGLPSRRPSLGSRRRWELVQEASRWMEAHLREPFRIGDVAAALDTPKRTIQQAFAEELGRPPLAQAKLLRLHALRRRLQDPQQHNLGIATQMTACGLAASGETAQAYRAAFGERPNQTKRKGAPRSKRRGTEQEGITTCLDSAL